MIKEAIKKLRNQEDLTRYEAKTCMHEIMEGKASEVQMSAYVMALSMKGETIEEITGSAAGMREHCIRLLHDEDVLEIVGTGGDHSNSFNISTTASIVIASAGVPVAKHGNRAASSKSGAADVLEALGVNIQIAPERNKEILNQANICFLFAQNYHIAMKYVAPVRKTLEIRTIFNILGPLTNPAGASLQVMGVYDASLLEPLAQVLKNLGVKRALVVYGTDGLDELSISSETKVCELRGENICSYTLTPEEVGLPRGEKADLVGGTPEQNAQITLSILRGEQGAKRDAVLLNAGAGLYVAGKANSIKEGVQMAKELIDSKQSLHKLIQFQELSHA
ncbi:anthranilate phosphoribosyltransferase [Erysipelotrichaceae bacterium MTC7]|nr:anthranilate phosphoribosyltransferase [Erysipelotrichaceae bacterium MTC7]